MGPSPACHAPEEGGCKASVEHWVTPLGRTRCRVLLAAIEPFPPSGGATLWGHAKLGPWVGEAKPLGKSPLGATPVPT